MKLDSLIWRWRLPSLFCSFYLFRFCFRKWEGQCVHDCCFWHIMISPSKFTLLTVPCIRATNYFFKRVFSYKHHYNFNIKYMWKSVNLEYGVGIRTHDLWNTGLLPLPLDQGSRPTKLFYLGIANVLNQLYHGELLLVGGRGVQRHMQPHDRHYSGRGGGNINEKT